MVSNAIILHGKPTRERYENPLEPKPHEANWIPWLGRELETLGVGVSIPRLPLPYHPVFSDWEAVFPSDIVGPDTALVGHSAGAEFLLRWISKESDVKIGRLVLVAPYRDYGEKYGDFSKFNVDPNIPKRIGRISIVNSTDDDPPIQRRTRELVAKFPSADLMEFFHRGHFRIGHNMTSPEFPELLEHVIN